MGKGKKKGAGGGSKEPDKVESTLSVLESLSISETPTDVQQIVPPAETKEEEEDGGLGLGGGRKKRPQKKKQTTTQEPSVSTSQSDPAVTATPIAPAVSDTQSAPTTEIKAEEDDGLGLGLGGAKRKRPPKKKPTVVPATTPTVSEQESIPKPVQASQPQEIQKVAVLPQPPTGQTFRPPTASSEPSQQARASSSTSYTCIPSMGPSKQRSIEPPGYPKIPKKYPSTISVPMIRTALLTNYLPMKIKALKISRYDVSFKPDRPKKMIPKAFMLSKNMYFKNQVIAFDQMKNCYTLKPLPNVQENERFVTTVDFLDSNGKKMSFEVSYKFTGIVDLSTIMKYMSTGETSLNPPTEAIQCIDVILRQGTLESYIKSGRQFFQRPAKPVDLGDGLEMWTGLFQSGIFTTSSYINIDVAHKGFPRQQPLTQALTNDFRLDARSPLESQPYFRVDGFRTFVRALRVVATIGGDVSSKGQRREFICNEIKGPANVEKFTLEDPSGAKKIMTVADYFVRVKGVKLRYPNLNCVWVGPRDKTIYYPMELLEVAYGQVQNKQLNENQLSTMVKMAATPPDERKRKIEEVIKNMNYSNNTTFKEFGFEITNQFTKVNAKVLMAPNLLVGGGQTIMPRKGAWQANRVYRAEALQSWGLISVECDQNRCDLVRIKDFVMSQGRQMGMQVSEPTLPPLDIQIKNLPNILSTAVKKNVRFLFVVVSAKGRDYYHRIKQTAEREVGILTQCMKEQTATMKLNPQTVRNILLKVNSKLMGINQVLDGKSLPACLKEGGVMVVGADVTHPSPDQSNIPSIAAVTASMDPSCFMYNIELSIQTPKKEMIVQFEDMMVDHLRIYRERQKSLPKKIFVFRDGVSEGQFAQVMKSELPAVHNAYKTMAGPQAKPEVMFLLVQKRHHTRFFVPDSPANVEPGTVVDTDIVHASELDFYLVSHQAIKGTARPTRYHAICNDGRIPHDQVEQLTYYLCHLYSRCMRSVSYPTPTYYAHLACLRARSLTHGERFDNAELEKEPKRLRVMDKILQFSRMFFV